MKWAHFKIVILELRPVEGPLKKSPKQLLEGFDLNLPVED
jgi:hypothetical protein